jgi:hypothetical protein
MLVKAVHRHVLLVLNWGQHHPADVFLDADLLLVGVKLPTNGFSSRLSCCLTGLLWKKLSMVMGIYYPSN